MGYLVNPISFRLGISTFWFSTWVNSLYFNKFGYDFMYYDILTFYLNKKINNYLSLPMFFDFCSVQKQKNIVLIKIYVHFGIITLFQKKLNIIKIILFKKFKRIIKKHRYIYIKIFCFYYKSWKKKSNFFKYFLRLLNNYKLNFSKKLKMLKIKILKTFNILFLTNNLSSLILYYFSLNYLNYFFFKQKNYIYKTTWFVLPFKNYKSKLVGRYISEKLNQGFTINAVLKPLAQYLKTFNNLDGFKIKCIGRFSRKDRVVTSIEIYKSIPFSTIKKFIDYSFTTRIMKYSLISIKIWFYFNISSNTVNKIIFYKNNFLNNKLN